MSLALHATALGLVLWFGAHAERLLNDNPAPLGEVTLTPIVSRPLPALPAMASPSPPSINPPGATSGGHHLPQHITPPSLQGLITAPATSAGSSATTGLSSSFLAASASSAGSAFARPQATRAAASFAGLHAQAASRIIYVVDASGAVVTTFTFIRERLVRSLDRLGPTQRFQIIFFRGLPDGDTRLETIAFDTGKFVNATPAAKRAAAQWINTIQPAGRSEPILGLRQALDLKPDLVFLLSTRIERTIIDPTKLRRDQRSVLDELDRLNKPGRLSARRPAIIKTVQFINDDPTGFMRTIANIHGDGRGSHRMLTRDDLTDFKEDAPPPIIRADMQVRLSAAAARLGQSERDGSTLAVLYGLAGDSQRQAVRQAATQAVTLLATQGEGEDQRSDLLAARAAVLLAAVSDDPKRRFSLAGRAVRIVDGQTLTDPVADAARRLTAALALHALGEPEAAADRIDALFAEADAIGFDATTRIEARMAAVLIDPGQESLSALDAELARAGSANDPRWMLLAAEAAARARLDSPAAQPVAFDRMLALLDNPRFHADASVRRELIYDRIASAGDAYDIDWSAQPPRAAFARALALARRIETHADARVMLLTIAGAPPAGSLNADALWEAALLAQIDAHDAVAASLLTRFVRTYPGDPRAAGALGVVVSAARQPDGSLPPGFDITILKQTLARNPARPDADLWRLDIANTQTGDDQLETLETVTPGTREATLACERYFEHIEQRLSSEPSQAATLLDRALVFAERHHRPEWFALARRLAGEIIDIDPRRAADLLSALLHPKAEHDLDRDEITLTLARALLAQSATPDARPSAIALLRSLTDRLEAADQTAAHFWHAWTLTIETVAAHGDAASRRSAQAQLARLRLLDADLGGDPWHQRLETASARLATP